MQENQKCSRCGAEMSAPGPDGHCLACLGAFALDPPVDSSHGDDISLMETAGAHAAIHEKPGDPIGRYKLLEKIGEGGCGIVYMAEQTEPVRRRVALKVIKLGMDTRQVVARFEAERQVLAMMNHPNIARILDGGATGSGKPFFVMELVQGEAITTYCDRRKFSTRQRLELFIDVCRAVQHAHQKGIIHRDIKPSNILVTEMDGKALPKIIDFGIAKATGNQRLTDKTYFTAFHQFIGTPAYMSPEQAGLDGLDVDARSDIYSLGMLLYEILTSRPAFDAEELHKAAVDVMLRTIREKEPPLPSARLTSLNEQQITAAAQCRQTEPGRLTGILRGDLDWIAMKTLEKDRQRRYASAEALSEDIRRHLDNEPILARPPDTLYQFQKLVRRHKLAFVAGAAVALALVLGIVASTWEATLARRAERMQTRLREEAVAAQKTAETEAGRSRQVAKFLKDMLSGAGPAVARGKNADLLREILQKTSDRLGTELTNQPDIEAELRTTIGTVYEDLGDYPKAEAAYRRALNLSRTSPGLENKNIASLLNNVANALDRQAHHEESESMYREALAMRRKLFGSNSLEAANSLGGLGTTLLNQGKLAEAEQDYREALIISSNASGEGQAEAYMSSLGNLAFLYGNRGEPAKAEPLFRETLALQEKRFGHSSPEVAQTLGNLALSLSNQGKAAEAEPLLREQLALRRKLLDPDHPSIAYTLNNLASMLVLRGNFQEAEAMYREALAIRRKRLGNDHPFVSISLFNLARVLDNEGRGEEADDSYREALSTRQKILSKETTRTTGSVNNAMEVYLEWSRSLLARERLAEAETLGRESLAFASKELPDSWQAFNASAILGACLAEKKDFANAEPLLASGYEGMKKHEQEIPSDYKFHISETAENLARLCEATGRPGKAAEWRQKTASAK